MKLSRFFDLEEFRAASAVPLSADHVARAGWLAVNVLDAARAVAGPLVVTSFVRSSGSWAHRNGMAVDVQPVSGDDAAIRRLAQYIAQAHRPGAGRPIEQVIYEAPAPGQRRAHVHIAIQTGGTPGYLVDARGDGRYTLADPSDPFGPTATAPAQEPAPATNPAGLLLLAALVLVGLYLARRVI